MHLLSQETGLEAAELPSTNARIAYEQHQHRLLWLKLLVLALIGGGLIALFLTINVTDWGFAFPRRGRKVLAMLLVGFAIAYSSVIFQTITNNRILTPSIIGFDSLYMLVQTIIVFIFGGMFLAVMNRHLLFIVNVSLMVLFAGILFRWLFQREGRHLYFLVLIGIIFGSLFGSFTAFMQRMIDPNDFNVLQDRMFASFNSVNEELLWIASICIIVITFYSLRFIRSLDVLLLGRDQAINLGVAHSSLVTRCMAVIAILVAVSTALVGPITFFGLLVANLSYRYMHTYRHAFVVPAATLISVIALVGGQLLVERVFTFSTSLSVIINFIGGGYFLYLLLRETRRD